MISPPDSTPTDELLFDTLEEFLGAVVDAGIDRIVLRHICEHRPRPGTNVVPKDKYRRVDLLAYQRPQVFKCVLEETSPGDLAGPISEAGLTVKIVSDNIT